MPLRRRALFPLFRRARRLGAPLRKVPPCGAGSCSTLAEFPVPFGISSIGGKRAFWGGGAQVRLRETRAATWGRPYGQIGTFRGGRVRTPAPAVENELVPLARQTQVQFLNRSNSKFCTPRAQWPGENLDQSLRFCAPGIFCPTQGVTSVMGDRGKAVIGERSSPLRRPPAILW